MYESAVNDNAEDFPKAPNIGKNARAEDDVKEFKYSQLEFVVSKCYNFF
jgi:hypothetical protein